MLLNNKKIAIIGAGPVGLTMATLLQQKGVNVTVYERDKDANARIFGGTLDLHKGSGQDAMNAAGLLAEYYRMAVPMGRTVVDTSGKILSSQKPAPTEAHDNPEINRNDLRKILLDSLPGGTVEWGRRLTKLSEQEGRWLLQLDNTNSATADLVIVANGGMSKLRKYVTDAEVEYTGTYIIQGDVRNAEQTCPEFYRLCAGNILMTAGNSHLLVANPKNNNLLSYLVTLRRPLEWIVESPLDFQNIASIASFLATTFSQWDKVFTQLFHATSSFWGLPARKLTLDPAWKISRPLPITLIGDAAHLMPPFAGQGVNIGMRDAVILSQNLVGDNYETIDAAVKDYEDKMLVYATEAQLETSINEIRMHSADFSFANFRH